MLAENLWHNIYGSDQPVHLHSLHEAFVDPRQQSRLQLYWTALSITAQWSKNTKDRFSYDKASTGILSLLKRRADNPLSYLFPGSTV